MRTSEVNKKIFIVPTILTAIIWVMLFLSAGSIKFWPGWIFWGSFSVITYSITIYFMKKDPEFLERRTKVKGEKVKKKSPAYYKAFYLGFILPGIDFRFNWSNESVWLVIISNIIVCISYIFIFYVFMENSFASTVIQVEEEQRVISTGPYKIVRHPMYLGMVMMSLFIPLALGSYISIIPMLLIIPIVVTRIQNEEEVLINKLNGYKEYCKKTPYKLIPFIW